MKLERKCRDKASQSSSTSPRSCRDNSRKTDRIGVFRALLRCRLGLTLFKSILWDDGQVGAHFAKSVQTAFGRADKVLIAERSIWHAFQVMPQQQVVERGFDWLEKHRRLWKNCKRTGNALKKCIHLAIIVLLLKKARTGSKGVICAEGFSCEKGFFEVGHDTYFCIDYRDNLFACDHGHCHGS